MAGYHGKAVIRLLCRGRAEAVGPVAPASCSSVTGVLEGTCGPFHSALGFPRAGKDLLQPLLPHGPTELGRLLLLVLVLKGGLELRVTIQVY